MLRNKLIASAAVVLALSTAASAATYSGDAANTDFDLTINDRFTGSTNIASGEEITYTFDVLDALTIRNFATSGSGTDNGSDLMAVRFGYGLSGTDGSLDNEYTTIEDFGSTAAAIGSVSGRTFGAGESFFFTFLNNGNPGDGDIDLVGTTVSFQTVAPIPVPAAGFLLVGALGAGAAFARRKKKADA